MLENVVFFFVFYVLFNYIIVRFQCKYDFVYIYKDDVSVAVFEFFFQTTVFLSFFIFLFMISDYLLDDLLFSVIFRCIFYVFWLLDSYSFFFHSFLSVFLN